MDGETLVFSRNFTQLNFLFYFILKFSIFWSRDGRMIGQSTRQSLQFITHRCVYYNNVSVFILFGFKHMTCCDGSGGGGWRNDILLSTFCHHSTRDPRRPRVCQSVSTVRTSKTHRMTSIDDNCK